MVQKGGSFGDWGRGEDDGTWSFLKKE